MRSDATRNTESLKAHLPILKHLRSVSKAFFQVCWSVTHTDLHCEELVGDGDVTVSSACPCHRPAICGSFKPGRTHRTGKRLHACGRKGSEEWRNWELWSIYWSRTSPVPNRCRIVVYSQRREGSRAGKKQTGYRIVCCQTEENGPSLYIREIQVQVSAACCCAATYLNFICLKTVVIYSV